MTGAENRLDVVEAKGLEYILLCLAPDAGISLDSFPTLRSLSSSASAETSITQSQPGLLGKVTDASIEVRIAYGCDGNDIRIWQKGKTVVKHRNSYLGNEIKNIEPIQPKRNSISPVKYIMQEPSWHFG